MHRRLLLTLVAGLVLPVAVACSSDDKPATTSGTAATAPATAAAAASPAASGSPAAAASPAAAGSPAAARTASPAPAAAAAQTFTLKAGERGQEFYFEPKELTVTAGKVTIKLDNAGPERKHALLVRTKDGNGELAKMADVEVGQSGTLEFTVTDAGTYEFICPLRGHADRGQKGTMTVKAAGT